MTTTTGFDLADRDMRQRDIIPAAVLAECHITVIGVGAIGRQVALMLAQPSMIKRPVLELEGGKLVVGFKEDEYAKISI